VLHPALLAEFRAIFEGRVEGIPSAVEYASTRKSH
jgi:hypothetical protein